MDLDDFGFSDVTLIEGERIDRSLDLASHQGGGVADNPQVIFLTDKRVIHLHGNGRRRRAMFAAIQEIDVVEVTVQHEGNSAFIWAALAFIVASLLYLVISQPVGRIAAAVIVALMGVYLIVDRLMSRGNTLVIFKTGWSQLQFELDGDQTSSEIYDFINRLFELKGESNAGGPSNPGYFSPR